MKKAKWVVSPERVKQIEAVGIELWKQRCAEAVKDLKTAREWGVLDVDALCEIAGAMAFQCVICDQTLTIAEAIADLPQSREPVGEKLAHRFLVFAHRAWKANQPTDDLMKPYGN